MFRQLSNENTRAARNKKKKKKKSGRNFYSKELNSYSRQSCDLLLLLA